MKINETLSESLGIEYKKTTKNLPAIKKEEPVELSYVDVPDQANIDEQEDYDLARETYKKLMEKGEEAIESMLEISRDSEKARDFEVVGTLIKTISETTREMYDLQERRRRNKGLETGGGKSSINVEQAVFVGHHSDLLKRMKEKQKEIQ